MKKISTLNSSKAVLPKTETVVAPSQSTLSFLKAFARSYHSENTLSEPLNHVCVN